MRLYVYEVVRPYNERDHFRDLDVVWVAAPDVATVDNLAPGMQVFPIVVDPRDAEVDFTLPVDRDRFIERIELIR